MRDFFGQLGKAFLLYWNEMNTADITYWLWLPGVLFGAWLISLLLKFIITKNKRPFKTIFTLHKRFAVGLAISGFIFALLMIYWWATKFYDENPLAFIHLCCLFLLFLLPVINLLVLRGYYNRNELREITSQPKTNLQQTANTDVARKSFRKLKQWGLLVMAGGLLGILIWGFKSETSLVSIVIDNSASMEDALKNGKTALGNTFNLLDKNTDIVITSFKPDTVGQKNSVTEIMAVKKYGTASFNQFFEGPSNAIQAINGINVNPLGTGSPILQNIWENYLYVTQTRNVKEYKTICLLIITDGADPLNDNIAATNKFLCQSAEFNEVFPAESIHIIDVEGTYNTGNIMHFQDGTSMKIALYDKAGGCGYDIQDGKTLPDYSLATDAALQGFKKDWRLLIWMGVLYIAYIIALLFINTGNKL